MYIGHYSGELNVTVKDGFAHVYIRRWAVPAKANDETATATGYE